MKIEDESLQKDQKHFIDENVILEMIAQCAYFKAEARGFEAGYEQQDWLEAEEEIGQKCFYWFQDVE